MSPSRREREYARRRYEKWQSRLAERNARRRQIRRRLLTAGAVVAGVLVVSGGVYAIANRGSDASATTALATPSGTATSAGSATPSGTATRSGTAVATGSATGTATGSTATAGTGNPCATPTASAAASPKSYPSAPAESLAEGKAWTLVLDTTCGPITLQLDGAKAPKAVSSAIFLARNGFWNGAPCHRLVNSGIFVLQCGDPTGTGTGGPGYTFGPVENAPANGVYPAGTVAMARSTSENSNGSQFFLVYKDTTLSGGYTVFGKIIGGMDVVEKVAAGGVKAGTEMSAGGGQPNRAISITSSTVTAG